MKTYCVFRPSVVWDKIYIEAYSKQEAIDKANRDEIDDVVDEVDPQIGIITLNGELLKTYVR